MTENLVDLALGMPSAGPRPPAMRRSAFPFCAFPFCFFCFLLLLAATSLVTGCNSETSDDQTCTDGPLVVRVKAAGHRGTPFPSGGDWQTASYVRADSADHAGVTLPEGQRGQACVDDPDEAFALAQADYEIKLANAARMSKVYPSPYKLLVRPAQDKFFEFEREDSGTISRVHRCAYLDTSSQTEPVDDGEHVLGTLSARPVTADVAREAAFYLFSMGGPPALSISESTDGERLVEDFEVGLISGGDWGIPDTAEIRHVQITVSFSTGLVTHSTGPVVARGSGTCE